MIRRSYLTIIFNKKKMEYVCKAKKIVLLFWQRDSNLTFMVNYRSQTWIHHNNITFSHGSFPDLNHTIPSRTRTTFSFSYNGGPDLKRPDLIITYLVSWPHNINQDWYSLLNSSHNKWPDWTWPNKAWPDLNRIDVTWPVLTRRDPTWPDLTRPDPTWPDLIRPDPT